jgi:hypothetical protein
VRAERERARFRLHLVRHRSALKNRIHAILIAFGHACPMSDLFGVAGRELLDSLAVPEPWHPIRDGSCDVLGLGRRRRLGCDGCFLFDGLGEFDERRRAPAERGIASSSAGAGRTSRRGWPASASSRQPALEGRAGARCLVSTAATTQWRQSAPHEPPGSEHDHMSFPGPDFRSATKVGPSSTRARAWSGPSSSNSTAPRSASSTPAA